MTLKTLTLYLSLLVVPQLSSAGQWQTPWGIDQIPVCYDFGCKVQESISISMEDWLSVAGWLTTPAVNAADERDRIRNAIGWMEVVIGRYTPTHRDKGANLNGDQTEWPGQLDCIDESLNTTTYLKLLEANGLFKWHRVIPRAYRRSLLDQHWAGRIEEIESGDRYVVDSWFQDNGQLPFVQEEKNWNKIPFWFTSYLYNGDN